MRGIYFLVTRHSIRAFPRPWTFTATKVIALIALIALSACADRSAKQENANNYPNPKEEQTNRGSSQNTATLVTKEDLASSYQEELSDLTPTHVGAVPLPAAYTELKKNGNGYTLLLVYSLFNRYSFTASEPVKDGVTQWIAAHHDELVKAKITKVGVKCSDPTADRGSASLDVK